MSERLLSAAETAERLNISIRTFHRYKNRLIAKGLQSVTCGRRIVFREASLDKVIKRAADNNTSIYDMAQR
jgi:predicted DNA-binding transcriptional regulator YafY